VSREPPPDQGRPPAPEIGRFLDEPTRDLADWRWLWEGDREFPIESHRGLLGRVLVAFKKLLRPLVKPALGDLWDRQRVFNLILLEHLERLEGLDLGGRIAALERAIPAAVGDALRHNDALFARADQKLDLYRREARDLLVSLSTALAALDPETSRPSAAVALGRALDEHGYLELERRYRGTEDEIAGRASRYVPHLRGRGQVLDLGCGRGEALAVLAAEGIPARGVDSSAGMVAQCRERGLAAAHGDLFAVLAAAGEGSLGGVISLHVVEHLPPESLDRLVRLAHRALAPGGVLILETPNPLSLVVAARNFWLDPTHRRPVHPESLRLAFELAGFDLVEHLELSPFPPADHLPEIDLATVPEPQRDLADRVNRLRDRLDDLLFGPQDYALIGHKRDDSS
jgi:O-antigen chain-terminating methyltransferase